MKSLAVLLFLFVSIAEQGISQTGSQLYMPLEFRKAYDKGTRKWDGSVSSSYWQNRSVYTIKAAIDPHKKVLTGEATIVYFNNSPDTLRRPTFHAYPNYYKPSSKKAGFFGGRKAPVNEGMVIDKLEAEGVAYSVNNPDQVWDGGTHYTLVMKQALAPGGKITLKVQWHFEIPGEGFERSGAIDSTSMFIAYWYPEMAVFDDIDGWDRILYDAATEFYHDYSDYSIELTAPDNFTLWASVPPDNPQEVYSPTTLERLTRSKKSTEGVGILTEADINKKSTGKSLTWKYTAKNFPDFAFALSDHFLWDAGVYSDQHGEYQVNAAYPSNHKHFAAALKTIGGSLKIFHNNFPVYPFPYKYFTIFNGLEGGGMEFPGMANDEAYSGEQFSKWMGKPVSDYDANLGLSLHEMCHMYFPFMMGIHEKKYAWMDEGMANFSGNFLDVDFPSFNGDNAYMASQKLAPVMVPSHLLETSGVNSYTVGSFSYGALYELLGKDLFLRCLKTYMDNWKHKHPTPYDFMFTFNRVSGQDLTWFWKKWYFDWGYMDLSLSSVKNNIITVENVGGRPLPFVIDIVYADGTTEKKTFSPAVWKNSNLHDFQVKSTQKIKSATVSLPKNADAIASNNQWKSN